MKTYAYKGEYYTILELENHEECLVAGHELRRNIWRYKMTPELAMVTPIKSKRNRCKDTYFYMGIWMTTFELMELPECIVPYNTLRRALRSGTPPEYALRNEPPPEKELVRTPKPIPRPFDHKPYGGTITFNPPFKRKGKKHTYSWLVSNRSNKYVMDEEGINLKATLDKSIEQ